MAAWDNNSDLKAALPDKSHGNETQGSGITADQTAPTGPQWEVKPSNYNYNEDNDGYTWDGSAEVYKWDGQEGDIGPALPKLELQLFGDPDSRDPRGIDFSTIDQIQVTQEGLQRVLPITTFKDAGLHPAMERNIELCGYKTPTPIQRYCIPAINMGFDLLAIAQTGSGKTAAYLIPILNHLMGKAKKLAGPRPMHEGDRVRGEPLVVIVVPSRELAVQIFNEARKFCYRTMLRPCAAYGGAPESAQIQRIQEGCDLLIATPGRLIALMERPSVLSLRRVKFMVIDEADEMLQADWDLDKILSGGEQEEGNVKYMLFSATFPTAIRQLAKHHLAETHIRIKVGRIGSTHANIKQEVIYTDPHRKKQALWDLLGVVGRGRVIIFVNGKRTADDVDDYLFNKGAPSTSMHSDRTQREREDAMRAFRSGDAPLLVTTSVTARGIDVRNVETVINYDLPSMEHGGIQEYIHRIGRTGRIGHSGAAYSFYTERDEPIAKLLTMTLMETGQMVPEFLEPYKPQEKELKFEYDTDEEEPEAGDDGWGNGAGDGGWGASNGGDGGDGWGAPTGGDATAEGAKGGNDDQGGWGAGADW